MRIQNNIMAMNAYRYYSGKQALLSKNLEKLSSGYRINRSADDAAGLAISEKMRAQITGLTTAQKNVKDGICLVQTAEGAMQEIHDMLNRMVELATQSANGTYQDELDRDNLQKEVVQIKEEIDRIANSANFNGIPLLNGKWKGDEVSGSTPGTPEVPAKKTSFEITLSQITGESDDAKIEIMLGSVKKELTFKDDFGGNLTVSAADLASKIAAKFGSTQTISGQDFTLTADNGTLKLVQNAEPATESEVVPASLTATVKVTSYPPKALGGAAATEVAFGAKAVYTAGNNVTSGGIFVVSGVGTIDLRDYNFDVAVDYMRAHGFVGKTDPNYNDYFRIHYVNGQYHVELARSTDVDHSGTPRILGPSVSATVINTATEASVTGSNGIPKKGQTAVLDFGELGTIRIICTGNDFTENEFKGNTNCGYYISANAPDKNGGAIDFAGLDKAKLAQAAKSAGVAANKGITLQWNTDHLELISDGKVVGKTATMVLSGSSAINPEFFDPADNTISLGTVTITPGGAGAALNKDSFMDYNGNENPTNAESFSSGLTYNGYDTKTKNFDPNVEGKTGNVYKPGVPDDPGTPGTPGGPGSETTKGKGLVLQIGDSSQEYDRLEIIIDDMHTNAMGTLDKDGKVTASIADVDVSTQDKAQEAVDVIKDAINYVSNGRGRLGAYQNRLDHTGNSLSVTTENIQNSESIIRDTDIAEEMMGYVKNNILLQAAQSMLAHANVVPEGVLQLLH